MFVHTTSERENIYTYMLYSILTVKLDSVVCVVCVDSLSKVCVVCVSLCADCRVRACSSFSFDT